MVIGGGRGYPYRMKKNHLSRTIPLLVSMLGVIFVSGCVSTGYVDGGHRPQSVGVHGVYTTLPRTFHGSAYYHGGRYYSGGNYQSGRYNYQGRSYSNRYYYNGQYIYGGTYRQHGTVSDTQQQRKSDARPANRRTRHYR